MATYKVYNYTAPKSWRDYMPGYTAYSYRRPDDVYSDNKSAYAGEIGAAQNRLNTTEANKPTGYVSPYSNNINALINNMANRKFTYDVNADALYNQYKKNYVNQGKMAMQDTIGQAAAMTGGYGNSYATAVGNQAYQSYLDKLNDRIPELYQLAMDRYNTEGADIQNLYSMLANQEAQEYGKYRDTVGDYQTDRGYYDAQLQNLRTMGQNLWGQNWNNYWNAADRTDTNRQNAINTAMNLYGQEWDNYHWANEQTQRNYEQAVAEDQWNANFAENQRQFNESQAQAAAQAAAQLAENQRQFNLSRDKVDLSGTGSGSGFGSVLRAGADIANRAKASGLSSSQTSESVNQFNSSILTPSEFGHRKSSKSSGSYNDYINYNDYVKAKLREWYENDRLTESDVAYLKGVYNIG